MARRCVPCFGETKPAVRHGTLLAGEFSSEQAHTVGCCQPDDFAFHNRQFAVAARRPRSGKAGIYILRDDQGGTLVLSADATGIRGNEAAVRRLDFRGPFFLNAFMGCGMAIAVTSSGACDLGSAVPRCKSGLRNNRRTDCTQRVWIESAESTPGNARADRHAAGVRDFSDRFLDLAKNSKGGSVETARSNLRLCIAHGRNVDQGTDCLRVFASWHWRISVVAAAQE